jgi:hypothetical protein
MQATTHDAYLPIGPLRGWLRVRINERDGGKGELAAELGFDDSWLKRFLTGPQRLVQLATVDRMFAAAGEPHTFAALYPLEGEDWWCSECRDIMVAAAAKCPCCGATTRPVTQSDGERWVPQVAVPS